MIKISFLVLICFIGSIATFKLNFDRTNLGVPCNEKEGYFFAHNETCEQYYVCFRGYWHEGTCDEPFWLNEPKQMCDYPFNVDCKHVSTSLGPSPTTPTLPTAPTTVSTASPTTEEEETTETNEETTESSKEETTITTESSSEEEEEDESTSTSRPTLPTAPPTTTLDPSSTDEPETSTIDESEEETSTPDGSDEESSTPDGSDEETSTPDGSDEETSTPDGSDEESSTPDGSEEETSTPDESDEETTEAHPSPTESTSTTPKPPTSTTSRPSPPPTLDDFCPPDFVGSIPHPFICSQFILCFRGLAQERICGENLHFSPREEKCVPIQEANCVLDGTVCPIENDPDNMLVLPDEYDCRAFFICYHQSPIRTVCERGQHWNPESQLCVPVEESMCEALEPIFKGYESDEIKCPSDEGDQLLPHPREKGKFFFCRDGVPTLLDYASK